jgi:hypothetical protein
MTIQNRAREAQAENLSGLGEAAEAIIAETEALYDSVDALTDDQKMLLVRSALVRLSSLFDMISNAPSQGAVVGFSVVGHAVTALAGYAIEDLRERAGQTATGDRKVDEALDSVKTLLGKFAESQMSPEQRAIADKIKSRVNSGEDMHEVMEEMIPAAKADTPSRYDGSGMYL